MIWRYANMCIVMNPGTYAKVNTQEIIGENPRFKRLFLSFRAMQTGFVNGCRPLIGIDGCHLTSEYGGVLLAAIALDADNGIFPIAYAVCEIEYKESWIWFLRLLHEALDWDDNKRICFMSDRQKGILAALKSEWPTAKNRYCFRHIFANYNNKFKSLDLRKKVWHAAKEAFQATYSGAINPIPDASRWPTVDNVPLDPPLRRTLIGRPKKNRRREPDEGPTAGRIFSNKCKKCGTIGHNKRTCTARSGRQDGKDDEGSDASSFRQRSWPRVLVREGRRRRGGLTANSGFTTTRGLDGDEWVSGLLISGWVVRMARATGK
ncbi:hypothetical protein EZV62_019146 [Acer yangbiense]|uniref:CCHC-type domain-containing protein n=1 Tax=Acer yangbiense TaxID=1000413 RepID=A0A5C7HA85_9ROSI|nr:hypothetical protein EZV62_019146 [Acer yangbiense]